MYNWSVDVKNLKKYPEKLAIFQLEQSINYGLNNQKIPLKSLKKYFSKLNIDPDKKAYLSSII